MYIQNLNAFLFNQGRRQEVNHSGISKQALSLLQNTIWKRNKNQSGVSVIIDLKLQISIGIVNMPRYCNLVLDLQKR